MKDRQSNLESSELRLGHIYGDMQGVARIFSLFIALVLTGLVAGILIVLSTNKVDSALVLAASILPVLGAWGLVRLKRLDSAILFLGVFLILLNTVLATQGLGIHSISNFAYPVILIIASLVASKRSMVFLTFLTVACIAWLVFGELLGLYRPGVLVRSVPGDFLSASVIVILTAMTVRQLTGAMFNSFLRARQEVAERRTVEESLRQREAILETVTFAAEEFLKSPNWRENIDNVLERLGRTFHVSHAYLFEHYVGADKVEYSVLKYEWTAEGQASDFDNPQYQIPKPIRLEQGSTDQSLRGGHIFSGDFSSLHPAERERLLGLGVKDMIEVPLIVDGRWWGTLGLDDMEKPREWSAAETDALKIAAGILSGAIRRQNAESAVRESERIYRQAIEAAGAVPYFRDYRSESYTFMGAEIENIIGYKPQEITVQLWREIMKENIPLGDALGMPIDAAIVQSRSGGLRVWKSDMRVLARNGEMKWLTDSAVELFDAGELSHASVGILQDITDRKQIEANLRKRESILEAITFSAEQFLETPDWRDGIALVLERLGLELGASHAYLFEKHPGADGLPVNSMRYEWAAPGVKPDMDNPHFQNTPEQDADFKRYYETLSRGEPFVGSASSLTEGERAWLEGVGIKALLEMRIIADGRQWGTLGFDDTENEREWAPSEVDVLRVAANMLGAAIKRRLDEVALKNELAERQRAEQALRFSEEKFSKAFHTTQVLMTIEDERHIFVDVNQAFTNTFGLLREDVIGHTGSELNIFHDSDDARILRQALTENNGVLKDFEMRYRHRTGETGYIILSTDKIYLDNVGYILTSGLDITERKRVEHQIQQHAVRAEVLASLSHLLTQVSQDYRLTLETVVRRCAELIGDGASIFFHSPGDEFLDMVAVYNPDPQAMEILREEIAKRPIRWNEGAYARVIGEDQPVLIPHIDAEEVIRRAPAERRDYYTKLPFHSMMLAPLHVQGIVIGVIGMARHSPGRDYTPDDLTFLEDIADRAALAMLNAQYYRELEQELAERRRLERELQEERDFALLIINNLGQGLTVTNADGRFLLVNPAFARLIGYDPDHLVGKDPMLVTVPENLDALEKARLDRQKGVTTTYECLLKHRNGSTVPVLITGTPRLKEGKFSGSISSVTDLTEIKWAQEERERLIAELSAKNAELEQFTYTVSHDLKSPLVTINGFLGYLEQDAFSGNMDRLKQDTQRIHEAVLKMQRLLNELLELSRIGRMMNSPEMIPFEELVDDARTLVQGRLDARGVTVRVQSPLSAIYGDRPRLVEVLQNLIDNAAKYMGSQPAPLIEIGQRGEDGESGQPVFFVRDNGMGIAAEHHDRIFGLFNKLDARSEGTGVGLALVKRIIEFHGGRIWVESEAGGGSTFLFTLPGEPSA